MRTFFLLIVCLIMLLPVAFSQHKENVPLFTKTTGFRHASILKGIVEVSKLVSDAGVNIFHTEDADYFCTDSLAKFDAVVFLNTTGNILSASQKRSFEEFIRSGKGYLGVHAASDTEYDWPWYGQLVGGYFSSHPPVQEAEISVHNLDHLSTKHLQYIWVHRDEWYDFKDVKERLNILMTVDEESYQGGKMGKFHPIAWFHEFDGGRSFYTGLGHTDESYDSDKFQKHILGGLFYVLGRD